MGDVITVPNLLFDKISYSDAETEVLGASLAAALVRNELRFIALFGELGAGKTAFVRGFISVIAPNAHVHSPTYSIVNEYADRVFHYDMYRVSGADDLISVGYFDMLKDVHTALVEWSENILEFLPERYIKVEITKLSESSRRITATEAGA